MLRRLFTALTLISLLLVACQAAGSNARPGLRVLAVETFLADIVRNVAGDRLKVDALMPVGADPHSFEPAPADLAKVADADVLIVNGAGFEAFLQKLLENAGGEQQIIEAAAGLESRKASAGEAESEHASESGHAEGDPHFWLDPINVIQYVENIRDGLSRADPEGKAVYSQNAAAYVAQLKELDGWIAGQAAQIPAARRLLVTNHETLGYFADRYGFKIIGAILPSVSSAASPSAQQLAQLVDEIKTSGAPAIFLEVEANPQLAEQIGQETGLRIITNLYTHSTSNPGGPAPTYLEMMRHNTLAIVEALK
ncbi:MAG: metal ABC transporter substrate-binding protein [Anaerolineales bacterium]